MLLSPAAYVIGKFGGLTKTATALGIPVTTVQGWKDRGTIPQKHWSPLIDAAKNEGERIDLADFITLHVAETGTGASPSPKQERAQA